MLRHVKALRLREAPVHPVKLLQLGIPVGESGPSEGLDRVGALNVYQGPVMELRPLRLEEERELSLDLVAALGIR
jgi:hypothetical protein